MTLIKSLLAASLIAAPLAFGPAHLATAQSSEEEQGTSIAFGSRKQNTDAPIDVTSARLEVDENTNTALFTGDVVVVQDQMTIYAPRVLVFYNEDQDEISHMEATGGVTMIQGEEAAEGERADYDVINDTIVMTGDVLVTQKLSAIASEKMTVKLETGTALMVGRVRTLLRTKSGGGDSE